MGIGTLRRYHDDSRVVGETPLPEGAVDAAREEAAAVAGVGENLELNDALNEAAAELGRLTAEAVRVAESGDLEGGEELAEKISSAHERYAELFAQANATDQGEDQTRPEQPDTPQTTEVRGDPEGQESKGDVEPTVTVKAEGDERPQGDATPQDGQDPPQAGETPAGGSEDPEGENGAQGGTEGSQEASTAHGDIERPSPTGSTDAWIVYAKADPKGEPFDLTKRPGLRDDLVKHYAG